LISNLGSPKKGAVQGLETAYPSGPPPHPEVRSSLGASPAASGAFAPGGVSGIVRAPLRHAVLVLFRKYGGLSILSMPEHIVSILKSREFDAKRLKFCSRNYLFSYYYLKV
jgi:hypothetical protein